MSEDPRVNITARFNYGVAPSRWGIPVKSPDGRVVGKVVNGNYNAVDGTTLEMEISDPALLIAIQRRLFTSVSFGHDEDRLVQSDPVPTPKIVHLVKSVKHHVAVCNGEPYSGSQGTGPVKLCTDCYTKTFRDNGEEYI